MWPFKKAPSPPSFHKVMTDARHDSLEKNLYLGMDLCGCGYTILSYHNMEVIKDTLVVWDMLITAWKSPHSGDERLSWMLSPSIQRKVIDDLGIKWKSILSNESTTQIRRIFENALMELSQFRHA